MNVVVTIGDVLDTAADVLISTVNPWLNMSGGVNGAICEREPGIQRELRAHLKSMRRKPGTCTLVDRLEAKQVVILSVGSSPSDCLWAAKAPMARDF